MKATKTQIQQFSAFLESISAATPNTALMDVIKRGFVECYPINEAEDDTQDAMQQPTSDLLPKIKAFFGKAVPADKIDAFAKGIEKAMQKVKIDDVAQFAKKAMNSNPKQEFIDAATEFFSGNEKAVTEGVSDSVGKLVKILAVAAMLAGGSAHAGDRDGYEKVKTEQGSGNVEADVQKAVKALMDNDELMDALETGDDVKDILVNNKVYKSIVSKYESLKRSDEALANAFARGVNRKLKELFSSDAPLIGPQRG